MAYTREDPVERPTLWVQLWRIIAIILLVVALLLVLAYCLAQTRDDDPATLSPAGQTAPAGPAPSTGGARFPAVPTTTVATTTAPAAEASTRPTARSTPAGHSAARTAPPRAAPNTGGGSTAGTPNAGIILLGSLFVTAALGLGLVTVRRWRRAR